MNPSNVAMPRPSVQPLAAVMKTPTSCAAAVPPGVAVPTVVQVTPSVLASPMYEAPDLVSRSRTGAVKEPDCSIESKRPSPSASQLSAQPLDGVIARFT